MTTKLWQPGASIKSISNLELLAEEFDFLELNMKACTDEYHLDIVMAESVHYADKIRTVHLVYDRQSDFQNRRVIRNSLRAFLNNPHARDMKIDLFVVHLSYVTTPSKFEEDLEEIAKIAEGHEVMIAAENLTNRKGLLNGFTAPVNPQELAVYLARLNSSYLGMTLDTGHAICNSERADTLKWDTQELKEVIRHIHLHDSIPGNDLHNPISLKTSPRVIYNFNRLTVGSTYKGIVVFEHSDPKKAIETKRYFEANPNILAYHLL